MARIPSKKVIAGVAGAIGVAATTQIPGVQAAMEQVSQTNTDEPGVVKKSSAKPTVRAAKADKVLKTSQVVNKANEKSHGDALDLDTLTYEENKEGNIVASQKPEATSVASEAPKPLTPAESAAVESVAPATIPDGSQEYKIVNGDTLGSIALKFGITVEELQAANPNVDSNNLQIGQVIIVPTLAVASSAPQPVADVPAESVAPSEAPSEAAPVEDTTADQSVAPSSAAPSSAPASSAAPAPSSAAPAPSSATPAPSSAAPKPTPAPTPTPTPAPSGNISAAQQATLDALNALRVSKGLKTVQWDASLAARAQARADQINRTGEIPSDHWSWGAGPEVIAIDWAAGAPVINAWNIDDASVGMITNNFAHRRWLLSADTTKVGFGISGTVIDGISNGTVF
ncbi:MAG: LysM peptidoglycan-binding domain-containing protein [Lactobacillaceae bacterium]|nr:LysM peptidoglycan-binding domain-containing protein [Lactobacillaceae bacterium]